jgi:hypothetical protein
MMPRMGFVGANVTIPHKEAVLALADNVSDAAARIGAANTLTFVDGKIHADNTDGYGFIANLRQNAPDWGATSGAALVLGAGGAARAVIDALLAAGAPRLYLTNRTRERSDALAQLFGPRVQVIDWDVLRRAQIAFLRSGVANLDTPQDHVFVASLLKVAVQEGVEVILTGANMATESILPTQWGYDSLDGKHIRGVFRRFGEGDFQNYPLLSLYQVRYELPRKYGIRFLNPLNEIEYSKKAALSSLASNFGWQDYGGKHYESVWTKYFQGHLLPYRFGYDKRKAHLSSRIASGELSRIDALGELRKPLYEKQALRLDEDFIASKLEIDPGELSDLKEIPLRHFSDYPNDRRKIRIIGASDLIRTQMVQGELVKRALRRACSQPTPG